MTYSRFSFGLLFCMASAAAASQNCKLALGEAVPNAETARRIAEAVTAAHQRPSLRAKYGLKIETDKGNWVAYQAPLEYPRLNHNTIIVTTGGGGIQMHISRCTGTISEMYLQK
jgi:hypothetical protein